MKTRMERYNEWAVLILLLALSMVSSLMFFGAELRDSRDYRNLTLLIQGDDVHVASPFAMRPVVPALAALLEPSIGLNASFGVINIVFIALTSFLVYIFCRNLASAKIGIIAGSLFALSSPVMIWGPRVLTDAAGFFGIMAGILLIERIGKIERAHHVVILGLFFAGCMLIRETLGFLLLYWFVWLVSKEKWMIVRILRSRALSILLVIILMFIPFFMWKSFTGENVSSAWLNWFNWDIFSWNGLWVFVFRSFVAFHVAWFFLIFGWRTSSTDERAFVKNFLMVMIPVLVFTFITTHIYSPRYSFMLFPVVLLLASRGILDCSEYLGQKSFWNHTNGWLIIGIAAYAVVSLIGALSYPTEFVGNQGARLGGDIRFALQSWMGRFT